MLMLTWLLLLPAQIEATDSADFPKKLQIRAVTATVRIHNRATKIEGSGVIVGKQGPFVYILTAHHIVQGADQLEIGVFSEQSYPKPAAVYRGAKVVAKAADIRDLALVRIVSDDKTVGVLPLCTREQNPKGDSFPALALGCALGQAPTGQINKVVAKKKIRPKGAGDPAYFWEWNDAVAKGRSGGPLIDKRGYVVGICSGTSDGKGYFTHPQEIHRFLKENVFDWLADKEEANPVWSKKLCAVQRRASLGDRQVLTYLPWVYGDVVFAQGRRTFQPGFEFFLLRASGDANPVGIVACQPFGGPGGKNYTARPWPGKRINAS